MNLTNIILELEKVKHPTINCSLVKLGIVNDIRLTDNKILVTFAFPYAKTSIADDVKISIEHKVRSLGFGFAYKTREMTEVERARFTQAEIESWEEKENE